MVRKIFNIKFKKYKTTTKNTIKKNKKYYSSVWYKSNDNYR